MKLLTSNNSRSGIAASSPHHHGLLMHHHTCRKYRGLPVAAVAGPGPEQRSVDSVISLALFPLPSVLHPAQTGQLLVYEPRYLTMFRDLQAAMPPEGVSEIRFGHILAPGAAPPALMKDNSVRGFPAVAVCAAVKSLVDLPDGKLQVNYQGLRRCQLLTVDTEAKPYPLAAATWVDDDPPTTTQQEQLTEQLEQDVYRLLQQVAKYMRILEGPAAAELPGSVLTYAPPPPQKQSIADYMKKAGIPAGHHIATWQRMPSVYSSADSSIKKEKTAQDPYQLLHDQLGKERRQELFSFAAASLLELGPVERLVLLQCRDTAARLQFVAAAIQPYLQDLVARSSIKQAINP